MKKYLIMLFVALAAGFQSCNNNDDLWAAIDDLKNRVQALETQVDALNKNIEALEKLYSGSTISDVKVEGGKYVITLSNGEKLELTQGSKAEALIPQIGIDKDGYWQVSYDGGKTFTKLDVKASASNGTTPQFRIDETNGYWQVSYDGGKTFANVLDTAGKPVNAVGSSTVTDKFFENVEVVDGMLEITLIGETEPLRVPIVKDFLCEIVVGTPGIQQFNLGETKTFEVKIKGVVRTEITAPEGWKAALSDAVADKATLTVTAPATLTRATADNTKDVTISAESASFLSTMAKIQVEATGAAPVVPTASVANSTTTLPTAASLTFDVTVADADGWKYICQLSTAAAPDAAKVFADGTAGTGASVTVGGLTASTAYKIYVVAYKGTTVSTLASIENTTAAAAATDYYQDYLDGKSFTIGTMTIDKTAFPSAELVKPSELTAALVTTGGLIFVDNSDGSDQASDLGATAITFAKATALVGRYDNGALPSITAPELRCKYDVAFLNVHIKATTAATNLFTSTNAVADPSLSVAGSQIDATSNVVYDSHATYSFKSVDFNNSIVKMTTANKPFYGMTTTVKPAYNQQKIKVTNTVFFAQTPLQNYIINCGDQNTKYSTSQLQIEITGCTFYNIYQPNILIRAYILAGLTVTENVGYYTGIPAKNYLTGVYDTANFTTADVSGNYLYTDPVTTTNFWSVKHTGGYTPGVNYLGADLASPFTSDVNVAKGYFPVDKAEVTNGAGASYDTKKWVK